MIRRFRPTAAIQRLFQHVIPAFQHLIPSQCSLCATELTQQRFCDGCLNNLPWQAHCCVQCGLSLDTDDSYCGHCLYDAPPFTHSLMPLRYEAPVSELIAQFKYHHQFTAGQALCDLLCQHLAHQANENPEWQMPDLLIPTPLHWRKRWSRGFNQAEFIAHRIARRLKIATHSKILRASALEHSQKGLNRAERQKNLRDKFVIPENKRPLIQGKHLVLIDDVVTTTATARELSRVLIKAGAARVDVWALARTPVKK